MAESVITVEPVFLPAGLCFVVGRKRPEASPPLRHLCEHSMASFFRSVAAGTGRSPHLASSSHVARRQHEKAPVASNCWKAARRDRLEARQPWGHNGGPPLRSRELDQVGLQETDEGVLIHVLCKRLMRIIATGPTSIDQSDAAVQLALWKQAALGK